MNADQFVQTLKTHQSNKEREKIHKYFEADGEDNQVIGVRMKTIFDLAKENEDMLLDEVKNLLDSPYYEARMGAVSIMDFKAREKSITEEQHKQLLDLYIKRHDRINNWDFVDRAAKRVVGKYLYEHGKSREILFELANSDDVWERRTAIVSTSYFIKKSELEDTFKIAELLVNDDHDLIHKAVGSWIRHAGKQNEQMLLDFLDKHAATMPRTMLRYATEKLGNSQKNHYKNLATSN